LFIKRKVQWIAAALAATIASTAGAAGTTTVTGNVAAWVKGAAKIGTATSNTSVTIAVDLTLRNVAGLKTLVAQVSSPKSSTYGRYLTNEEFASLYAPASADVSAVKSMLEQAGMANVTVGPHGAYVSATATVGQLTKAFDIDQNLYAFHGMTLRANTKAPSIPASLGGKVLFIEGLDDSYRLRKPLHQSAYAGKLVAPSAGHADSESGSSVTPPPVSDNNASPYCNKYFGSGALVADLSTGADVYGAALPWLNCGYVPSQIQAAYGLNQVKYNGAGVTVAIVDAYASPTLLADSNQYFAHYGVSKLVTGVNFNEIIPEGIYNVSPSEECEPYDWWGEQSLDVQALHGAAPGANILFIGSRDCGTSLDIALQNVLYNHLADVVTNSWSDGGESLSPGQQAADDQALLAGAAQGMTVLFSSGDDGDLAALNGIASGTWPATSPYVTGVGGTTLEILDSSGAKAEYGWGGYYDYFNDVTVNSAHSVTDSGVETTSAFGYTFDAYTFFAGSGGGISLLESQPSYQAAVVPAYLAVTLNLASGYSETLPEPMRVSPDVAMDADPYTGYLIGESYTIAGNAVLDAGCTPTSKTVEYCEQSYGGTSLASPLFAGVVAVMNQKRLAAGEPVVGFANPLLYGAGSKGNGVALNNPINQIVAPTEGLGFLQAFHTSTTNLKEFGAIIMTANSAPFLIVTSPYALEVCGLPLCLGLDDVFNFTSLSPAALPPTPAGYNDVTGLGVPWVPKLVDTE